MLRAVYLGDHLYRSQVRNERNKTREDCRQLRSKLEVVVKEFTGHKREKQELITETDKLKAEIELNSIRVNMSCQILMVRLD